MKDEGFLPFFLFVGDFGILGGICGCVAIGERSYTFENREMYQE